MEYPYKIYINGEYFGAYSNEATAIEEAQACVMGGEAPPNTVEVFKDDIVVWEHIESKHDGRY